jgi:hypothetical protein
MRYIKDVTNFYQEQDTYVFWPINLSVLIALLVISLWAINYFNLPKEIPLFYSLPWGDMQFGHINQFILFPSLIVLIILINLIISWHLHFSQILIKRVLAIASLIMSVLLGVAAFKIIFTFI